MNTPHSTFSSKGFLALLIGAVAIAFAPIFVRLSDTGLVATAFYRIALALPILWVALLSQRTRSKSESKRTPYGMLALAGFFFALDLACWHWSIGLTTVANSTLLANFAPFVVAIGAYVFLKEPLNKRIWGSLCLSIIGAVLLVGPSLELSTERLLGDGFGLLTAVFYGAYQLTVRHLRKTVSPLVIMAWSGIPAAAILLLISVLTKENLVPGGTNIWLVLLGLALVSHIGGQGMITYGFGHLPAAIASISLLIQPVVAAIVAWMLFQEGITLKQGIGGLITLSGIYLASRISGKKE